MTPRRELAWFCLVLTLLVVGFFQESLLRGRVLSPADVLFASKTFEAGHGASYEPKNRLLIDPVLQFQPWIAFNRSELRAGRLPLWNPYVGCGAPHLGNGQSAVFDPFLIIAYLGSLPHAFGWIAAARLWFAGLGMFLLVRAWGWSGWGRWFSGLTFPFCGFLIVWLQYPVTSAAVWLPWILLASDRIFERVTAGRCGWLALSVAGTILGGHVQTSAHVLLLAGVYVLWKGLIKRPRVLVGWSLGVSLGILIAAIEVLPLGFYLSRSPVWSDRVAERPSAFSIDKPRLADAACVAMPYAFGSQRRGHPNLAKALGVHNLNESAGGFCGLATLIWLAPLALMLRRERPVATFLAVVGLFGLLASLKIPGIDNLLRLIPVINVTDNRRMSLWTAFALSALGGLGIEALGRCELGRGWRNWSVLWVVAAAICLLPAVSVRLFETRLLNQAKEHYAKAAAETPGADPLVYQGRAERQTRDVLRFIPRYYSTTAVHLLVLAGMLGAIQCGSMRRGMAQPLVLAVVLADLVGFGYGLNPAISVDDHTYVPSIVASLASKSEGRVLALGSEMPPNSLMRFGLRDVRNYDSVELSACCDWFEPLFEPNERGSRTSRREVTWTGVARGRDRLVAAGVRTIISPLAPPPGIFGEARQVGGVWITSVPGDPIVPMPADVAVAGHYVWSAIRPAVEDARPLVRIREMAVPGWRAWVDGVEVEMVSGNDPFLKIPVPEGPHRLELIYAPIEVKWGLILSFFGLACCVFALTVPPIFRSTQIVRYRLGRN